MENCGIPLIIQPVLAAYLLATFTVAGERRAVEIDGMTRIPGPLGGEVLGQRRAGLLVCLGKAVRRAGWVSTLVLAASVSPAQAEPSAADRATAQILFEEARELMSQRRYAEACPKLEESVRLLRGIGAQFNLASCYEEQGRTASAWAVYLATAAAARAAGQTEREQVAREKARALEAHLPQLTVVVPADLAQSPGVEILRDGDRVSTSQWGLALPVDPGEHLLTVSAPGRKPWRQTVSLKTGEKVSIELPELAREADSVPPPSVAPAGPLSSQAPQGSREPAEPRRKTPPVPAEVSRPLMYHAPEPRSNLQRNVGFGLMAAGAVGFGVGAVFGLNAISKKKESSDFCNSDNQCSPDGVQIRKEGLEAGNISSLCFAAGGVVAVSGAALVLLAPRAQSRKVGIRALQFPGGTAGIEFRGQW